MELLRQSIQDNFFKLKKKLCLCPALKQMRGFGGKKQIKYNTMNTTIRKSSIAYVLDLKVGNMKKAQQFCIYPYSGGDDVFLQSGKRWIELNLRTGAGKIIAKGVEYANRWKMYAIGHIDFQLDAEILTALQEHLWNKSGMQGNSVMKYENKPLFSA